MVASALVTNPAWEWDIVGQYLFAPSVVRSVLLTLELTALGIALGFALGTVLALMRLSTNRLLPSVAWPYVWLFRSVPLILQLLFWYELALLYPRLPAGVLGLNSGRVQAYFGPNPAIACDIAVSGGSRIAGTFSGAGPDLQDSSRP